MLSISAYLTDLGYKVQWPILTFLLEPLLPGLG